MDTQYNCCTMYRKYRDKIVLPNINFTNTQSKTANTLYEYYKYPIKNCKYPIKTFEGNYPVPQKNISVSLGIQREYIIKSFTCSQFIHIVLVNI